jgi:hypothetical protein
MFLSSAAFARTGCSLNWTIYPVGSRIFFSARTHSFPLDHSQSAGISSLIFSAEGSSAFTPPKIIVWGVTPGTVPFCSFVVMHCFVPRFVSMLHSSRLSPGFRGFPMYSYSPWLLIRNIGYWFSETITPVFVPSGIVPSEY